MSSRLAALLALVDDPNPVVAEEVTRALEQVPDLKAALEPLEPSPSQRRHLQLKLEPRSRRELLDGWLIWRGLDCPYARLEAGLEALATYQSGLTFTPSLGSLLNRSASDYLKADSEPTPEGLARFLFEERLLPARESYYLPENSDLISVWHRGQGIPLSLVSFYVPGRATSGHAHRLMQLPRPLLGAGAGRRAGPLG